MLRRVFYAIGVIFMLVVVSGVSASVAWRMAPQEQTIVAVRPAPIIATLAAPKTRRFLHPMQPSDVEILLGDGLGSGVHIGDGLFLTAAHVVAHPSKRLDVRLRDNSLRHATVLWASKDYDIALLSADGRDVATSKLACRDVKVGEPISSIGNPLGVESITAFGRVAGETRQMSDRPMFVADMTVVMGNSGGPIFDDKNEIVGIADAVMVAPLGNPLAPTPSLVGYSYAVPSSVICKLLARAG
jgi:S1-C subfamily serine protease